MKKYRMILAVLVAISFIGILYYYFIYSRTAQFIFSKARKSIVLISVYDPSGKQIAIGSGFILNSEGLIVTNYHVIKNAAYLAIKTSDDRLLKVEGVQWLDRDNDVALIKVKKSSEYSLPSIRLERSGNVEIGEKIYALGNPKGLETTFSDGIISGLREISEGRNIIQITAPISAGSSGGPVLNSKGRCIGIAAFLVEGGQSLNFAIPTAIIKGPLMSDELFYSFIAPNPEWRQYFQITAGILIVRQYIDRAHINSVSNGIKGLWTRIRATEDQSMRRLNALFDIEKIEFISFTYIKLDCSKKEFKHVYSLHPKKGEYEGSVASDKGYSFDTLNSEVRDTFSGICSGVN